MTPSSFMNDSISPEVHGLPFSLSGPPGSGFAIKRGIRGGDLTIAVLRPSPVRRFAPGSYTPPPGIRAGFLQSRLWHVAIPSTRRIVDSSTPPEKFSCFQTSHAKKEMRKIRIWDYEEIEKNRSLPRDWLPDTAMRSGESNTEWRFRMLLRDLQALAAEPEILLQAFSFPGPDYVADDLAEDFAFHVELAERCVQEGLISQEMWNHARAVDAKLEEMSKRHDPSLWTDEALRGGQDWVEVRRLAREALRVMGYDLEPPPPRSM